MKRILIGVVLVFALPAAAQAQGKSVLRIGALAVQIADVGTSQRVFAVGGEEGNVLLPKHPVSMAIMVSAKAFVLDRSINELWKKNKAVAIATGVGVIVGYGFVVRHNLAVYRRVR